MKLRLRDSDGNRWLLWPVSLRWGDPASRSTWGNTHGWQTGTEAVSLLDTAFGCMPGFRKVYGQTLHLGRLKVCFGRVRR